MFRATVLLAVLAGLLPAADRTFRVFVTTDLGGDPDDIQSLYRLVHYSDILKVEGIVSSPGPGAVNSAEKIRHWLQRVDVDHLRRRGHRNLLPEKSLLAAVRQGATQPGPPSPERATEGARLLIERARAGRRNEPLWVLVWGSLTDVAQALHDDPSIASRIRLYVIGSNNTRADVPSRDYVHSGMAGRWPGLWWIENGVMPPRSRDTFRGIYQGGDQSGEWGNKEFVARNIRGLGTTHNGLFSERAGDAFPLAQGPRDTLKEGDSPSMLFLLSPVLGRVGNVDDPTVEGWGGRFRRPDPARFPNYYADLDAPPEACQETIAKWRRAFLQDWKDRWLRYGDAAPDKKTLP